MAKPTVKYSKEVCEWLNEKFEYRNGRVYNKQNGLLVDTAIATYRVVGLRKASLNMNKVITAHQLIWFLCHGKFADLEIDHIDRNKLNNDINNLREVTHGQNIANQGKRGTKCKSKYKGVEKRKDTGKWRAKVSWGVFDTEEEAAEAYNKAAKLIFGEHACLNEVKEND